MVNNKVGTRLLHCRQHEDKSYNKIPRQPFEAPKDTSYNDIPRQSFQAPKDTSYNDIPRQSFQAPKDTSYNDIPRQSFQAPKDNSYNDIPNSKLSIDKVSNDIQWGQPFSPTLVSYVINLASYIHSYLTRLHYTLQLLNFYRYIVGKITY